MEEFEHSYVPVADDNSASLSAVFTRVTSLDDFLSRDERMPFHPVTLDDPAREINIDFDFDGIMIEVSSLAGVKVGIHRLRLPEFRTSDLRNHFPQLRKHILFEGIGDQAFKALASGVQGVTLATADGQLDIMLSTVPRDLKRPDPRFNNPRWVKAEVVDELNDLVGNVKSLMKGLSVRDKHCPSIMKTVLTDLSSMDIVGEDQSFIMGLLDTALAKSQNPHFHLVATLHRFWQKSRRDIPLGEIVDLRAFRVRRVHHLFHKEALVLPFATPRDYLNDWDPVAVLQLVLGHMVQELKALFHANSGKGGFEASWQAYQLSWLWKRCSMATLWHHVTLS